MPRFLLFAALLTLVACHKKDDSPTLDFGADEGISYRSSNGMANGAQDPTDWTSDATWNEQETALFGELSISLTSPQQPNLISFNYVYPNPAKQANWILRTNTSSTSYTLAAVLVNQKYQVIKRFDHGYFTGGHLFALDYAQLGLNPNETYRIYYVVFNNNGLVCKGHGDVRYAQ